MAKPNYAFEKRQRDLAKKKKKDEKRLRKIKEDLPQPDNDQHTEKGTADPVS